MSTRIEWTNETWNPTRGCTKVSAGCTNCYAMRQAHRFSGPGQPYEGLTHLVAGKGPQWTGAVRLVHEALHLPLRWRKPRRVFVDSMSDLFHPDVPDGFVAQVFAIMAAAPRHTFQVLTKRPERMAALLGSDRFWVTVWMHGMEQFWNAEDLARIDELSPAHPLDHVWLGTSVENQDAADERIPHLLRCPAAVRFLSCEPLLGPVALTMPKVGEWPHDPPVHATANPEEWDDWKYWMARDGGIKWLIAGGESGPGARPCDVAWLRSLRDQCAAAGVPYFLKQLGARPINDEMMYGRWPLHVQYKADHETVLLRDPKGGDPEEWPEDLRVREFPQPTLPDAA